ncbi:MAG: FliM/FliN family flagellar motor switch protein [Spirochaetales bacterium]|nr:FliM/FliN family flagellar motor switch protein [Spirochaetales bacterium]
MEIDLSESDLNEAQQDDVMSMLNGILHYSHINIDLTDIEQFIMKTIAVRPICRFMTSAFNAGYRENRFGRANLSDKPQENVLPKPSRIRMENNPQFVQAAFPTEMVILVTIEAKIGDEDGMINVCLPYPFVKYNMIEKGILSKEPISHNEYRLLTDPYNAVVTLGQFHINEGKNAAIGDLIPLNTVAGAPLKLINLDRNEIFAEGEVVVIDDNLAVRITDVLDSPQNPDADICCEPFGPNIKSGNAYARLGQFMIRENSKFEEGTLIELDTIAGQPADLVLKGSGKVIGRGDIVIIDENFGIRVTEVL